jgi:hypothetical protein
MNTLYLPVDTANCNTDCKTLHILNSCTNTSLATDKQLCYAQYFYRSLPVAGRTGIAQLV